MEVNLSFVKQANKELVQDTDEIRSFLSTQLLAAEVPVPV